MFFDARAIIALNSQKTRLTQGVWTVHEWETVQKLQNVNVINVSLGKFSLFIAYQVIQMRQRTALLYRCIMTVKNSILFCFLC